MYVRHVDSSTLAFSLSSHRLIHKFCLWISLSRFNKQEKPLKLSTCSFSVRHTRSKRNRWLKAGVSKNRQGQYYGDIELAGYLGNASGPGPLVLDLRIAHDRVGSSADPTLNGHLRYPNNLDRSLNETVADKVRKYRADYNNNPPSVISFMVPVASTSGRLHSEFITLLFLQTHRETDRFFAASTVQLAQTDRGIFHYLPDPYDTL